MFYNIEPAITIGADLKTLLPNLAHSWQLDDSGRTLIVQLRPGIRWSDGVPLTSADFVFAFNDLLQNPEYWPTPPPSIMGGRAEALDPLTFRYTFLEPNPLFTHLLAQFGDWLVAPRHYFSRFHPDYAVPAELEAQLEAHGFHSWAQFIRMSRNNLIEATVDAPTLRAYRVVRRTPTVVRYERNPYYFKVDPEGRQLPYIDTIEAEIISDSQVVVAKASTGQLDFAADALGAQDIPLLKLGQRSGAVEVKLWRSLHGSDLVIQPNYNHADSRLARLYQDKRFRRALSLAIDRQEINQIVYFGRAVPRQVTVIPESSYFEPRFADAYTEYQPSTANALLDEMGLVDADGDGFRDYPDHSPLRITAEFIDAETPKALSMELITSYWREVGIDVRIKLVDRSLQWARAPAGKMEMTVWHADRTTDILFPLNLDWWAPVYVGWSMTMWNDWSRWYLTDGQEGEEPPPELRQLQRWADAIRTTLDEEERIRIGKRILLSNAENLWSIGSVGLAPKPIVTSRRLRNVADEGIWGWDTRWTLPYYPATWFFSE